MAFIHEDFMLSNEYARELYHGSAEDLPIIDYHCHLSPQEIAENIQFRDITQLWLGGDHYNWRAMRENGVSEDGQALRGETESLEHQHCIRGSGDGILSGCVGDDALRSTGDENARCRDRISVCILHSTAHIDVLSIAQSACEKHCGGCQKKLKFSHKPF